MYTNLYSHKFVNWPLIVLLLFLCNMSTGKFYLNNAFHTARHFKKCDQTLGKLSRARLISLSPFIWIDFCSSRIGTRLFGSATKVFGAIFRVPVRKFSGSVRTFSCKLFSSRTAVFPPTGEASSPDPFSVYFRLPCPVLTSGIEDVGFTFFKLSWKDG